MAKTSTWTELNVCQKQNLPATQTWVAIFFEKNAALLAGGPAPPYFVSVQVHDAKSAAARASRHGCFHFLFELPHGKTVTATYSHEHGSIFDVMEDFVADHYIELLSDPALWKEEAQ